MEMGPLSSKPAMSFWEAKCDVCGTRPCVRIWSEIMKIHTLCGVHFREVVPLIAAGLELPVIR